MSDNILTLNAGSSSIKFSLYSAAAPITQKSMICEGGIDGLGGEARFRAKDSAGKQMVDRRA